MRISVWSSDVCSSDLKTDGSGRERPSSVFAARQHRWPREPDRFSIKRSSARQHYTARRNIGLQLKVEQSSAPAGKAGLRRASTASELHVVCQAPNAHCPAPKPPRIDFRVSAGAFRVEQDLTDPRFTPDMARTEERRVGQWSVSQ